MIYFIISAVLPEGAAARDRPAETRDRRQPSSGSSFKRKPPRKIDRNLPPSGRKENYPDGGHRDGGTTINRPPRIIPPIHYHDTYIKNIYNIEIIYPIWYRYHPVCLPGLLDGGLYEIGLPFGAILPWEIGEFYLIRLKNLEKEGLGGRNTKFYVLSLEGDTIEFRRELRDAGVYVMKYDQETEEYFVRSTRDNYNGVAALWWVARVSGVSGEPFFLPEDEWIEVGMAP